MKLKYYSREHTKQLFSVTREFFYMDYGKKFNTVEEFEKFLDNKLNAYHDFFLLYNKKECIGCVFTFSFNENAKCMGLKIYLSNDYIKEIHTALDVSVQILGGKYSLQRFFLFTPFRIDVNIIENCNQIAVFPEASYSQGKASNVYCYQIEVNNV